jgi:hypothetical protein
MAVTVPVTLAPATSWTSTGRPRKALDMVSPWSSRAVKSVPHSTNLGRLANTQCNAQKYYKTPDLVQAQLLHQAGARAIPDEGGSCDARRRQDHDGLHKVAVSETRKVEDDPFGRTRCPLNGRTTSRGFNATAPRSVPPNALRPVVAGGLSARRLHKPPAERLAPARAEKTGERAHTDAALTRLHVTDHGAWVHLAGWKPSSVAVTSHNECWDVFGLAVRGDQPIGLEPDDSGGTIKSAAAAGLARLHLHETMRPSCSALAGMPVHRKLEGDL